MKYSRSFQLSDSARIKYAIIAAVAFLLIVIQAFLFLLRGLPVTTLGTLGSAVNLLVLSGFLLYCVCRMFIEKTLVEESALVTRSWYGKTDTYSYDEILGISYDDHAAELELRGRPKVELDKSRLGSPAQVKEFVTLLEGKCKHRF